MITLTGVSKRYGAADAVKDLNFTVEKGQVLGLLGQNGAGKTTTLSIMTGYLAPSAGRVTVNGFDVQSEPRLARGQIGYLPEVPPLYDEMTVKAYLKFACELKMVVKSEISAHIQRIARETGLEEMLGRRIGNLSKGYRQRVGLAQALCGDPEVLILDEPTSGLDPKQTAEFRDTLKRLAQGRTVIFSSHILSEVTQLCDRVLILHKGQIVRDSNLRTLENAGEKRLLLRVFSEDEKLLPALRGLESVTRVRREKESEAGGSAYQIACKPGLAAQRELSVLLGGMNIAVIELREEKNSLEEIFLRCTAE